MQGAHRALLGAGCKSIGVQLDAQGLSADDFLDGLEAVARGEDTPAAEAAKLIVAETILMHRIWLKSMMKGGG